jgi:hypothetical protein
LKKRIEILGCTQAAADFNQALEAVYAVARIGVGHL